VWLVGLPLHFIEKRTNVILFPLLHFPIIPSHPVLALVCRLSHLHSNLDLLLVPTCFSRVNYPKWEKLTRDWVDNPISRFRAFLVGKGWWSEDEEVELISKNKSEVLRSFSRAEKLPKPKLSEMFNDVWATKKGDEVPGVIVRLIHLI